MSFQSSLLAVTLRFRRVIGVALHLLLIAGSSYFAFWLRFDGEPPTAQLQLWELLLPLLLLVRAVTFLPFGLYLGLWRYTGLWDLRNIVLGVCASSAIFYGLSLALYGLSHPRSVLIIDAIVLVVLMSGVRLSRRIYGGVRRVSKPKRVLIFGAGDAGALVVREMKHNPDYGYEAIGFIDDDENKTGRTIDGVQVFGTRKHIPDVIRSARPDEVLIAIPGGAPPLFRGIVKTLEPFRIPIKTLPHLRDLLDGRVEVSQIRDLAIEDLLPRAPVGLDPAPVRRLIEGRSVLVTGAGGSIGSELSRQIATLNPAELILMDRYENSLYAVATALTDRGCGSALRSVVGDVTDRHRLDEVFARYRPAIVFHAAAHKHVPLMEENTCEAVRNNVAGTRAVIEAAEDHGADRVIFISTDKAVNPTSVMGATKRAVELLIQARPEHSRTSCLVVRFGNVLGSNGSVVPRFLDQIRAGGPVTVTHPEVSRYFMLIDEAVQLVLHAAAKGVAGTIYVLDMGEPVRVADMARNLIRLAGKTEGEVAITFTGLRPGEKLAEELVGENERLDPSGIQAVTRVQTRLRPESASFLESVRRLEDLAHEGLREETVRQLQVVVPEYKPRRQAEMKSEDSPVRQAPPVAAPPQGDAFFDQTCPACRSKAMHRSHAKALVERLRRSRGRERLFRCENCGWRGWLLPLERFAALQTDEDQPQDLREIDEAIEVRSTQTGSAAPQWPIPKD